MKHNISPNFRHRDVVARAVNTDVHCTLTAFYRLQSLTIGTCCEDTFALKLVLNKIKSHNGTHYGC